MRSTGRPEENRVTTDIAALLPSGQLEPVLSLYRGCVPSGRGGFVFLAGNPGSGRSALLTQLQAQARELDGPPKIALTRLGPTSDGPADPPALDPALSLLTGTLSVLSGPVGLPVLGLISSVISISASARKLATSIQGVREDDLDLVTRILRAAAAEHPLMLLIDDADQVTGSWWSDLLRGFASEVARELPLFVVMTVNGPMALGPAQDDEPDWLGVGRRLVTGGVAAWQPVERVTTDAVQAWIGNVSGDVVRRLVELTGGLTGVTAEMWDEWQELEIVRLDGETGEWRFATDNVGRVRQGSGDIVRRRLETLIGDRAARQDVYDLLGRAAMEGRRFTPSAIAHAMGVSADEVHERLTQITRSEVRPLGIVTEAVPAMVEGRPPIPRFQFTSVLVWWSVERYGLLPSEEAAVASALATGLIETYGELDPLVARPLARLFAFAGEPDRARHFRRAADSALDKDVVTWQARRVCAAPREDWDQAESRRAMGLLERAARILERTGPLPDGLTVTTVWRELADQVGDSLSGGRARYTEAIFLGLCGAGAQAEEACRRLLPDLAATGNTAYEALIHALLGNLMLARGDLVQARAAYERALDVQQRTGDRPAAAGSRGLIAGVDWREGAKDEARAAVRAVMNEQMALGDEAGAMNARFTLGWMDRSDGIRDDSRQLLNDVLDQRRETVNVVGEARTLHELATLALDETRHADAHRDAARAVRLRVRLGDRAGQADSHFLLGRVAQAQEDHRAARDEFQSAQQLRRELGDAAGEADAAHRLGVVARADGDGGAARDALERAVTLRARLGRRADEATSRRVLGATESAAGNLSAARNQFEIVLQIVRELGDERGEAVAQEWLGSLGTRDGDSVAAIAAYAASAAGWAAVGDASREAGVQVALGKLAADAHDWPAASRHFARALELRQATGDEAGAETARLWAGTTASLQNDYAAARTHWEAVIARRKARDDRSGAAWLEAKLVRSARWQGDLDASRRYAEATIAAYAALGDGANEAGERFQLGVTARLAGDLEAARASWERAASRAREVDAPVVEGRARQLIALLELEAGHTEGACRELETAIARLVDAGDDKALATARVRLGVALCLAGQHDAARRHLEEVLTRLTAGDVVPEETAAVARHRSGQLLPDLAELNAAEQDRRERGPVDYEAALLFVLGIVERNAGCPEAARECFGRALALAEGIGDERRITTTRREIAALDAPVEG